MEPSNASSEQTAARQGQEKFEFYLVSLNFTLLALAVQTGNLAAEPVQAALELVGWTAFLIAGLAGLYRLQWVPIARNLLAAQSIAEQHVIDLQRLLAQGQTEVLLFGGPNTRAQAIVDRIGNHQDGIGKLTKRAAELQVRVQVAYDVHWWAFVIGLLFVMIARAYTAVPSIVKTLSA